ncbi:lipopolysaccharide biosynthesis protein [Bradyrhizobium sp. 157]|uniref:lipopolysaccharide biosynthesis protein n=1 Tax=Bradyrhizobium sp. 157 TaxID=2782631 RepID=UPI001FF97D02|nr:lipopolysaccharide biosynthesis protein [Bradyrhizobium sp. 157]MCK1642989.1 lipopolysaccharide biosynthesis protein [Bradyrhizobium sp. 157]
MDTHQSEILAGRSERNRVALSAESKGQLRDRTVRGGVTNLIAQAASLLLQLILSAILARLILPSDFGLLAMAGTAVAFISVLTTLGLTVPTIQSNSITQEQISTLFFLNAVGGIILFGVMSLAAPIFGYIFDDGRVPFLIILLSLSIPIVSLTAQFSAVLARNMRWLTIQGINLSGQIVGGGTAVFLAWNGWGVYALIVQSTTSSLFVSILIWLACPWRPSLLFNLRSVKSELAMSADMLVFNLLNYAHRQADNLIIGGRWGALELGYYSRAYNLTTQASSAVTGPLTNALVPALSRLADDSVRWRKVFLESASVTAAVSGGLFATLWAVREPLVGILFGERWGPVVPILGYLAIAGLSTSVCSAFSWAFISLGRTRNQLYWILLASPVLVLAFWLGSPFGGLGVAISYAVAVFLLNFLYVAIALNGTPVTYVDGLSIKLMAYSGFGAVVLGSLTIGPYLSFESAIVRLLLNGALAGVSYVVVVTLAAVCIPACAGVQRLLRTVANKLKAPPRKNS